MATPVDLATRQQVYLERLKAGHVRDWKSVQASLRNRIKQVLNALDVESLQGLSRVKLQKVLFGLRSAMIEVTAPAMVDFINQLPDIATYAANLEATHLESLGSNAPKFNAPTAKLAYQAALDNPVQATGQMMLDMIKTWPTLDAMRVSNLVQKGWAQDLTVQDMVRQAIGTAGNNYEDGFLDVTRKNATTIINTAIQHTANAARMEVWENNGDIVQKYQWVSTLDNRTTQVCRSLDGQVFEAGKGPMPPLHPNCRSTTVAVLDPAFDFLDAGATRASSGPNAGYVDADQTYYEWLKNQPADFQDTALGPTRAQLFRDGGLTAERFGELNLSRDFKPLTLDEMRDIEPDAFKKAGL